MTVCHWPYNFIFARIIVLYTLHMFRSTHATPFPLLSTQPDQDVTKLIGPT